MNNKASDNKNNRKKTDEPDKEKTLLVKFNREKVDGILDRIKRLVSGLDTPIKQFVTNTAGSYSELMCKRFIERLLDFVKEYPLPEADKKCMSVDYKNRKIPYEIDEDALTFYRSFFYCSIRIALYEEEHSGPDACLENIIDDALSVSQTTYNIPILAYEELYQNLSLPRPSDLLYVKINNYYWFLARNFPVSSTDISRYENSGDKKDKDHAALLLSRTGQLREELDYIKEKNDFEVSFHYEHTGEIDDVYNCDISNEEMYDTGPDDTPPSAFNLDLYDDLKEKDRFIKNCELFRFYMNVPTGYHRFYERVVYAVDRYISENDLSKLSNRDKTGAVCWALNKVEKLLRDDILS